MKGPIKKMWVWYTHYLGRTIVHPQYITRTIQYDAVELALKHAKPDKILLDIGCGWMPYRDQIEPHVKKYIGLDHPVMSKLYPADKKPDIIADAQSLPMKNSTYDIVLMLQMIFYVKDPVKALKEAYRVMKKKGVLILSNPFLYPLVDTPHDRTRFTDTALRELFEQCGFSKIKIRAQGNFFETWVQLFLVWLFRTLESMVSSKNSFLLVLAIPFGFFSAISILLGNSIVFVIRKIYFETDKTPKIFPLNYTVTAIK
jgi:SAM-dependent methyltransferase